MPIILCLVNRSRSYSIRSPDRTLVVIDGPQCEDCYADDEMALQSRVFEAVATVATVPEMRDVRAPEGYSLLIQLEKTILLDGVEMRRWILFGRGVCDIYLSGDGTSAIARMLP